MVMQGISSKLSYIITEIISFRFFYVQHLPVPDSEQVITELIRLLCRHASVVAVTLRIVCTSFIVPFFKE